MSMLDDASAFALVSRHGGEVSRHGGEVSRSGGELEVYVGEPTVVARLSDLPLPPLDATADQPDLLAVVPYRQIRERGLACVDDGEPLVAIRVTAHARMTFAEALRILPEADITLDAGAFDQSDADYEATVRRVVETEIGRGSGSNFVLRRSFRTRVTSSPRQAALTLFRRLLRAEQGTYWTFLVHWNGRTLIGATPECHARLERGVATMNPISGTYRYPATGPTTRGLLDFLADRKEVEELFMVVDEELKTMAKVCEDGGRLRGPALRAMSRLAHTEYFIDGGTSLDVREVLRLTLPAPTVTGSPLATACRVIAEHERTGRGYYGGALALIGRRDGRRTMDSALLIRTADLRADGRLDLGVGATLVRHSDPRTEAVETRTKAATLLRALSPVDVPARAPVDSRVARALAGRNTGLSRFWLGQPTAVEPALAGRRLLVVDAEDDFTAMLARLAGSLGLAVQVESWRTANVTDAELVLVGPGPGDPQDRTDPRIDRLHRITRDLMTSDTPFLAVCLGHQVLADELGLEVRRLAEPAQGVQRLVHLHGRTERVGFYNTFAATSAVDEVPCAFTGDPVRIVRDPATGAVHMLSTSRVRSMQFHVESVLTENGPTILRRMLVDVMGDVVGDRSSTIIKAASSSGR